MGSDTNDKNKAQSIWGFMLRQPLAFLGAVGIVSMLSGIIKLADEVQLLVTAFQSVTQPIWDFLLGWLFAWFDLRFPSWSKDYLTMGVITYGASMRSLTHIHRMTDDTVWWPKYVIGLFFVPLWPIVILINALSWLRIELLQLLYKHLSPYGDVMEGYNEKIGYPASVVFFEFVLWIFILIAASFGLLFYRGGTLG